MKRISKDKDSLGANVQELQPEPGQGQRQHHSRKRKCKPRCKVYHVAILREESAENKTNKTHQVKDDKEISQLVDDSFN